MQMQIYKAMLPVAGVWSRQWEEDPLGDAANADRSTLVLWTQASQGLYVDMRLPIDSPGRSMALSKAAGIGLRPSALAATGFSEDAKAKVDINSILRQKSFAGYLEYKTGDTTSGDALRKDHELAALTKDTSGLELCTCFWKRHIDYQPPTGGLDVGVCASGPPNDDGSHLLRETGDDASYAEGWLRQASSAKGPFMALELISENGHPDFRKGYWVRAGNEFAYAVGYPLSTVVAKALGCPEASAQISTSVGKSLKDAVYDITSDSSEILDIVGSYVVVTGKVEGDTYSIESSTNPELVGCSLLGGECGCSDISKTDNTDEIEQRIGDLKRVWRYVEREGCELPFS